MDTNCISEIKEIKLIGTNKLVYCKYIKSIFLNMLMILKNTNLIIFSWTGYKYSV